jgi:leucyl-tRNA synthetase/predicted alpha/beta hydrolase family esterase
MYNHLEIDKKWQNRWESAGVFKAEDYSVKPKKYLLVEFPFPSGAGLHVGHPRSYVALDVMARMYRAQGNNVLYPMGWDAFGLPTENYAIKTGRPPAEATAENIATFKGQIQSLGLSFDWSREINSTDPGYYKWTQWQFLQFFNAGLAYKAKTMINWCPKCKIGLANEEAQGGVCERCGGPVEKREKEQWMIGITKYADRLISDLETVDYLPRVRKQQEEWIGKSEGAEIEFKIEGSDKSMRVFTTRPDTLFGVTYVTLAPEHTLVGEITTAEQRAAVSEYVAAVARKTEMERTDATREKTGVFTGAYAMNPANNERVPVWISDYVLAGYGTGAVMAVPAHDERDWEFAKTFGLPIKNVVAFGMSPAEKDTIASYEKGFAEYIEKTPEQLTGVGKKWIDDFLERVRGSKAVLEIGTASGRDADYFSANGLEVIRTDAVEKFVEYQKSLGHAAEKLNILDDALSCDAYDGVFANGVLLHANESGCAYAIRAINNSLKNGGFVALSFKNGVGEKIENEKVGGARYFKFWKQNDISSLLNKSGFDVLTVSESEDGKWLYVIAQKKTDAGAFVEEGVAVNSDFLNGLATAEAKTNMIAWLEEQKVGTRKITYKLRDWVFSRQRYWGEPIPLVHCDSCAAKKQKVLFIHGFASSLSKNEMMRRELEAQGFEVLMPTMSTKDAPEFEKWMDELAPYFEQLGEDDIVMGHSLGGHAAVSALVRAQKKIKALLLMAPAIGEYEAGYWDARMQENPENAAAIKKLADFLSRSVDLESASKFAASKEVVWSTDDDRVPEPTHEIYPTGWYVNRVAGLGHLRGEAGARLFVDTIAKYKNSGWVPLPDAALPLTLPEVAKYEPTDNGESPLASIPEFLNATCPRCGGAATRETDTMPNWAGSSWYFLRYIDAHNDAEFAAADKLKYWMPVDLYNGGMEHTTLHLLYSRFWNKFMFDCGFVPTSEPYARRVSHGLIMAEDGTKMSKSKGNVVNPDEIVAAQGADTLRMYELFIGPFSEPAPWSENGVSGVRRFLDRVMRLPEMIVEADSEEVLRTLHKTLKKVSEDIDRMSFNTAVAQHMTFVNSVYAAGGISRESLKTYVRLLSVFAPHVCEELWEALGGEGLVSAQSWPQFNHNLVIDETFELVVQINGKVRDRIIAATGMPDDELKALALSSPKIVEWLAGEQPEKVIVVKGKLVNIVIP